MPVPLDAANVAHRPWPIPSSPWTLRMDWHDLAFLHWPVSVSDLRPLIPTDLEVDTFDGSAWIGVVPFRMTNVRPRFTPAVPGLSAFPEINVRTYVTSGGKPGVWFFSLDVTKRIAVTLARKLFHLPYFRAQMQMSDDGSGVRYASSRATPGPPSDFIGSYRPTGEVFRAEPGSIEHWFTERYCLYSANKNGAVFRGDVHHAPWPLQAAECDIERNTMCDRLGVQPATVMPSVLFARKLEVVAWTLRRVEAR